jgi:hypothetical protein
MASDIMAPQPLPIMVPQTLKRYGAIGIEDFLVGLSIRLETGNVNTPQDYPTITGALGPSAAIMAAITSPWGRAEPRTESEITEVLKINAIFFSQGSISGTLTYLTKNGRLRRIPKGDKFAYTPSVEALATA